MAPISAMATNGYFSHGYGMKAKGMGGAGIAYGQDGLAAATNPANMVRVGNRIDFGLDVFMPDRKTEIVGNGGGGNASYDPNKDKVFFIPEFGYNKMINNTMSFGVSVFGNGGMNTSYKKSIALFGGATGTKAGVNLEQLFISPTFSMKIDDKNSFGVALNLIYQTFEASGLQNFDNATYSSSPGNVTDNGKDTSTGYSLRLGWTGEITDKVTLGATYQNKADMSAFSKYKGLFAEQGSFDIPESYGVGIAVKATPKVNVAFDITQINYSGVKAISNPLLPNLSSAKLGNSGGAGFGWQDMTVYKLGVDWQQSSSLVLRAGYNHSSQPIPNGETFFNLLAPGVVEDHLTAGATWTLQNQSELTFALMYAMEKTVKGSNSIPSGFGSGEANLTMSQLSLGVAYGWKF
ncbi:MAG TPA: long-chain fatty acid transporter [Gammaproteobacteria bacterium]|nr:long-chain fatty acid transporter [Gammaproteobacteria bacterium]